MRKRAWVAPPLWCECAAPGGVTSVAPRRQSWRTPSTVLQQSSPCSGTVMAAELCRCAGCEAPGGRVFSDRVRVGVRLRQASSASAEKITARPDWPGAAGRPPISASCRSISAAGKWMASPCGRVGASPSKASSGSLDTSQSSASALAVRVAGTPPGSRNTSPSAQAKAPALPAPRSTQPTVPVAGKSSRSDSPARIVAWRASISGVVAGKGQPNAAPWSQGCSAVAPPSGAGNSAAGTGGSVMLKALPELKKRARAAAALPGACGCCTGRSAIVLMPRAPLPPRAAPRRRRPRARVPTIPPARG